MKYYLLLFMVLLTNEVVSEGTSYAKHRLPKIDMDPKQRAIAVINTIKQRIDHFSPINKRTFDMRYTENSQFFNGSGPMFVFIGGESNLEYAVSYMYYGLMYEIAQQLGAYIFLTEHRYYGESIPNGNLRSFNLRYLTVKQALADLATFIQDRKSAIPGLTKVVAFGGSYAGNLAAWVRLKYPNIVDAAVSASGTFKPRVNNAVYNEVVQTDLSTYPGCVSTIHNGIVATQKLLKTFQGIAQVQTDFNTTNPMISPLLKQIFFNSIAVMMGSVAQYDGQDRTNSIAAMCGNLTQNSSSVDDYTRLANYITALNSASSSDYSSDEAQSGKAWLYQMCTELGDFVTTDSVNQPYSNTVPVSYYYKLCSILYGPLVNPARVYAGVNKLARTYGGMNINVTKVVFTVGTVDPWSASGLTQDVNSEAPVLIIEGSSHCAVLVPASRTNSTALYHARNKIRHLVATWVQ